MNTLLDIIPTTIEISENSLKLTDSEGTRTVELKEKSIKHMYIIQ